MFYLCLAHGASIREKDRIPFEWCFRTQPRSDDRASTGPHPHLLCSAQLITVSESFWLCSPNRSLKQLASRPAIQSQSAHFKGALTRAAHLLAKPAFIIKIRPRLARNLLSLRISEKWLIRSREKRYARAGSSVKNLT